MERRTFHSEQLSRLLLPHKVHLPDVAPSQHLDLVEAAGTHLHLHREHDLSLRGGKAEEVKTRTYRLDLDRMARIRPSKRDLPRTL